MMEKEKYRISIVVPAYNEEQSIGRVIKSLRDLGPVDEIIVVDNNSTDRTAELASDAGAKVVKETKQGYGYALIRGMREATGDVVILTESDETFEARDVSKFLAYIEDADMVVGTRTCMELVGPEANMGLLIRWGNIFIAKVLSMLYGGRFTDVGCTMRAIRKDSLDGIIDDLRVGGSHFSPEMILEALRNGLKVVEIPVNYGKRVGESKITGSKMRAIKVGLKMLWLITTRKMGV